MNGMLILVVFLCVVVAMFYLPVAFMDGRWPVPKLNTPPAGMRWELREVHGGKWHNMHLVTADGESVGDFIACVDGNPTDWWRIRSADVVRDYKRSYRGDYLPEIAGYTVERKEP